MTDEPTDSGETDGDTAVDADADGDADVDFGPIKKRLKSVRSRMLLELAENDEAQTGENEASVTHLRDDDGAAVPSGSLDHHLAWLRGERRSDDDEDLPWWPENVGPLAVEVDRVDMGYGTPTKVIGLTEDGKALVDELRAGEGPYAAPGSGQSRSRSHTGAESGSEGDGIAEIEERLDEMQSAIAANSERVTDYGSTAEENQRKIAELDRKFDAIREHIESMEQKMGMHDPPRN